MRLSLKSLATAAMTALATPAMAQQAPDTNWQVEVQKAKPATQALSAKEREALGLLYTEAMLGAWRDYQHQSEVNPDTEEARKEKRTQHEVALAIGMALQVNKFRNEPELKLQIQENLKLLKEMRTHAVSMTPDQYQRLMDVYGLLQSLDAKRDPLLLSPEDQGLDRE